MKKIKLFCIPHAGGSAVAYYRWKRMLDEAIEVIPLELAGRSARTKEPFYTTFEDAVNDLYKTVKPYLQEECKIAFFGHSMGSWLAYEVCHLLQSEGQHNAYHLILSGRWAPNVIKKNQIDYQLPEDKFLKQIYEFGGTPKEVLIDDQLKNIFIPVFREDLRILENYRFNDQRDSLHADFSIFTGIHDEYITQDDLVNWRTLTNGSTCIYKFKGNHFFINTNVENVVRQINHCLLGSNC